MKILSLITMLFIMNVSNVNQNDLGDINNGNFKPFIPDNVFIHINHDGRADFEIRYREIQTCDVPSSGGSIIGSIKPLNGRILYRYREGSLFLNNNDTIRTNNNSNSRWSNYGADIISIRRHQQIWDKRWSVISKSSSSKFLAFKIYKGVLWTHSLKIGWMYLEFDLNTGEVIVSDFKISPLNELIIKKKQI